MKDLKLLKGLLIVLLVGASLSLTTIFGVVELLLFITGEQYNADLLAMCVFTSPITAFAWWYYVSDENIKRIRKMIGKDVM